MNYFDNFLYFDKYDDKDYSTLLKFVLSHVIVYFISGIIFGNQLFVLSFLKTVIIEISLLSTKNCSIYKIDSIHSSLMSIIIGMISYAIGGMFHQQFYNFFK